jgi:diguanylate cyclase (GGDEF)-like protein
MKHASGGRVHLSIVVPIGVIVAVAIACVVVAVFSAARRADEVALDTERQLFMRAISTRGERMLKEIESIATSEAAHRRIRESFDPDWAQVYLGRRLQSFFDHDFVFIIDAADQLLYASLGGRAVDPGWFNSVRSDFADVLGGMRAPPAPPADAAGAARVQQFLGSPAIVAAAVAGLRGENEAASDPRPPVVLSVKLIDDEVLADIASHLQLQQLRRADHEHLPAGSYAFDLADASGEKVARFAWSPKQPGTAIVHSVLPFITIAIAGFVVLAGLVLRHMRRTAVTIAAGESRLRHLALHDPLCGLPNRIFFGERLEAMIDKVRHGGPTAAVFYIDLDHFKDVNDTLGHPVGDELIRNVTSRLSGAVREGDLVARLGGDEFAVITAGGFDHGALQAIATRMISAICAPYSISNQSIVIGASIGIAVISKDVEAAYDVMRHADLALYRAKNEGRNRACIYDSAMDADLLNRKLLENDLRSAIDGRELAIAYQPIVNNSGERVVGVEALCRWMHPARGDVPPAEFIPVAENSGLIIALGEQVLRRACLDGKAWPGLSVAVNVSPLQFRRSDFVDMVERILAETEFEPTRLELEVTESTLLGNVDCAEIAMLRLKALGVRLALDDFGTGYSSMLYLRRFPFDKLKIDSSFVRSIERAADAAAIVHAVVSLGRGLGMKVTAEGVETAEQHLFLRAAGVHAMQGYRFGCPGPAGNISARIAAPDSFRIAEEDGRLAMAG